MTVMLKKRFRLHNVGWYNFLNARSFMRCSCKQHSRILLRSVYFPCVLSRRLFCLKKERVDSIFSFSPFIHTVLWHTFFISHHSFSAHVYTRSQNILTLISLKIHRERLSQTFYKCIVCAFFASFAVISVYPFPSVLLSNAYLLFSHIALKLNYV